VTSAAATLSVNQLPNNAGPITGITTVLQGQSSVSYFVNAIGYATSYLWNYTGMGVTINGSGSNITIDFGPNATVGYLTVAGVNSCGNGQVSPSLYITVIPNPSATLSIQSITTGSIGSSVSIPVIATNISNMAAFQFTIEYNNSKLSYVSCSDWGGGLNITQLSIGNLSAIGKITFLYSGDLVNISNGQFFKINFTVLGCPSSSVSWSNNPTPCELSNNLYEIIPCSYFNGSFTCSQDDLSITSQPISQTKCVGESVTFSVVASGTGVLTYQWKKNGVNVITGTGGTSPNYTINPLSLTDSAFSNGYTCFISNGALSVTSNPATLTVNSTPIPALAISGPSIVIKGQANVIYFVPEITNANYYQWNYTGQGAEITGNSDSVQVSFSIQATSGILTVRGINDCGEGLYSEDFPITVDSVCGPGWSFVDNYEEHMSIVAQLYINGVLSTNPYDSLAAFVGSEIRGLGVRSLSDPSVIFLSVGWNNPPGESLTFKAWSVDNCQFFDVLPSLVTSDTLIGVGDPIHFQAGWQELLIHLNPGWNWFSVNVNPGTWNLNAMLYPIIADSSGNPSQIKTTSDGFAYYIGNHQWYGTLNTIKPNKMYAINVPVAQDLVIQGLPVPISPISLNKYWSWIGYLPQTNLTTSAALSNMVPVPALNDQIKTLPAKTATYIGSNTWYGTMTQMSPGKGYKIYLSQTATLTYPQSKNSVDIDTLIEKTTSSSNFSPWNCKTNFENLLTLVCKVQLPDGSFSNSENDFVSAFMGDECRGIAHPMPGNELYFLSIGSNDASGEEFYFRYFTGDKGIQYGISQRVLYGNSEALGTPENPVILKIIESTGIPDESLICGYFLGDNYPNPFSESTTIPFGLADKCKVSIKVIDLLGREVINLLDKELNSGLHQVKVDNQQLRKGLYFYRLQVISENHKFMETRRMVVQ
jgi:hypothetical protein